MDSSKVPYSMLGLDPLLRAFVKLYIGDILTLEADKEVKGRICVMRHFLCKLLFVGYSILN